MHMKFSLDLFCLQYLESQFLSQCLHGEFSTDKDPSLRIESFAIRNLCGVSTKLNKYIKACF